MVENQHQARAAMVGSKRIFPVGQIGQGLASCLSERRRNGRSKQRNLCIGDLCSRDPDVRRDEEQQTLKGKYNYPVIIGNS